MAFGREPVDYSYSPSGSTIELIDLASARQSSRRSSRISSVGLTLSWHPKLTFYRLLVILSTVGLAVAKAATSYLNLTFASITLEWILGVVVFLFFHLLGAYEETNNRYFTWLFNFDCMEYFWILLEKLIGFSRPYYISDEIHTSHMAPGIHPPVTGYRILVTLVVASVGMAKSALLYGKQPTEATTVECVFGVGIVTILYWLGLYEASSLKVYPKLFHVDYSGGLSYITETAIVSLHLFALLVCGALSYGFYLLTAMILSPEAPAKSKMGFGEHIVMTAVMAGTSSVLFLGGTIGFFGLMYNLGRRYLGSPLGQFVVGLPGVRLIPSVHRKYWLPSTTSFRPRPRFFYLKRLLIRQSIKIPLNLYVLYVIIVGLIYCVTFTLAWYSLLRNLLDEAPWYGLLVFFLVSLFMVPAILITIAAVIYFVCKGFIAFVLEAWKDFTVQLPHQTKRSTGKVTFIGERSEDRWRDRSRKIWSFHQCFFHTSLKPPPFKIKRMGISARMNQEHLIYCKRPVI